MNYTSIKNNYISLNPSIVARVLGILLFLLSTTDFIVTSIAYRQGVGEVHGLARVFSLDGERNLPTAYNVFLLLVPTLLLATITFLERRETGSIPWYWAILMFGFCFMAMDEAWTIHEDLIIPLREKFFGHGSGGAFHAAWVIPGMGVVFVLFLFYLRFLFKLPKKHRVAFIVSGAVYLSGALGMEMIDNYYMTRHGNNYYYKLQTILEESLEMTGLILFIKALLTYLNDYYSELRIKFHTTTESSTVHLPGKTPLAHIIGNEQGSGLTAEGYKNI